MPRKSIILAAALLLGMSLSVFSAPPRAAAAFNTTCVLHAYNTWTDGVTAYAPAQANCNPLYPSTFVTGVGSKPEHKSFLFWYELVSPTYTWTSGSQTISHTRSGNCNGMGTNLQFRTWAWGINKVAESQIKTGSVSTFTC